MGASPTYSQARSTLDAVSGGDGTTTTLLFAEKNADSQPSWHSPVPNSLMGNWAAAGAYPMFGVACDFNDSNGNLPNQPFNNGNLAYPSSNHIGGVVVAFCDGHVVFLKESISRQVYAQLVTSDSDVNKASQRIREWQTVGFSPTYDQ